MGVAQFDPECHYPGTMPMATRQHYHLVNIALSFSLPPQDDKDAMIKLLALPFCHCIGRTSCPITEKLDLPGVQSRPFACSCWSKVTLISKVGINECLLEVFHTSSPFFWVVYKWIMFSSPLLHHNEFLFWNFTVHCSFEKFFLQCEPNPGSFSKAIGPPAANPALLTSLAQLCAFPKEENKLCTHSLKTIRCEQSWLEIKQIYNGALVW